MCSNWKFIDYCPLSNSSSVNTIDYYEPNNSQIIKSKLKKNYYNDDHVYLFALIEIKHTVTVSILFLF